MSQANQRRIVAETFTIGNVKQLSSLLKVRLKVLRSSADRHLITAVM